MNTIHANEFGGDPFPVQSSERPGLDAGPDPKKENREEEEESDFEEDETHDLGGGD